ncbi:hypothetical protein [Nocardia sp. NPDC049707]|uniref:hypothetical protein n=1 Tax=Nocardia sp. NPDC049707 TaxID=3154735 RepID=UPI00343DE0A8
MSGYIEFSDGTVGLVDDDGWVDEFDGIETTPELESTPALGAAFIDVDATSVVDTQLPERTAFVGPPAPMRMPDGLPTVELMDQFVAAVREWGES